MQLIIVRHKNQIKHLLIVFINFILYLLIVLVFNKGKCFYFVKYFLFFLFFYMNKTWSELL